MKSRTKSLAMKKADRYFSEYIRLRDANSAGVVSCITCGQIVPYSECDAGHFIDRSAKNTRYNEQNVNGQCQRCNRFLGGRQYEHGRAIDLKYGPGTAEQILTQSKSIIKANQAFYEQIAVTYKQLADEERSAKGL